MVRKIITYDPYSSVPKYRQIINSIYHAIDRKRLKKGDKIPSINQICADFNLSRDTVMVAFNELKAKGIIMSQPGKGYYIASTDARQEEKVFLLFDELNSFKEDLYNSFLNSLEKGTYVDIFFHHFNYNVFKNLIIDSIGKYTSYVIMPATFDNTSHLINKLPKDRVYILDRVKKDLKYFPVIYQDFECDLYDALYQGIEEIKKYNKLVLINPGGKEPEERETGFRKFCVENKIRNTISRTIDNVEIETGVVYIVISDRDLVKLVKGANNKKLVLGKNIGIISLNDTILKEVVGGGITTISTDFKEMGKKLAEMVQTKNRLQERNSSALIMRASL